MSKIAQAYKEQRATPVTFEQLVEERKQWYEMQDSLRKIITHQENMIWDLEQKLRNTEAKTVSRNVYIIVYKGFDGLEQVGSNCFVAPCQAQEEIMRLEKQYGKSMKFQLCKITGWQLTPTAFKSEVTND